MAGMVDQERHERRRRRRLAQGRRALGDDKRAVYFSRALCTALVLIGSVMCSAGPCVGPVLRSWTMRQEVLKNRVTWRITSELPAGKH